MDWKVTGCWLREVAEEKENHEEQRVEDEIVRKGRR